MAALTEEQVRTIYPQGNAVVFALRKLSKEQAELAARRVFRPYHAGIPAN